MYYGAQATMNVWNLQTQIKNEFSLSQFWITGGGFGNINTIEAGMMVYTVSSSPFSLGACKTFSY